MNVTNFLNKSMKWKQKFQSINAKQRITFTFTVLYDQEYSVDLSKHLLNPKMETKFAQNQVQQQTLNQRKISKFVQLWKKRKKHKLHKH